MLEWFEGVGWVKHPVIPARSLLAPVLTFWAGGQQVSSLLWLLGRV